MRGTVLIFLAVAFSGAVVTDAPARRPPRAAAEQDGIRVYFSPDGGAADAVIHEVERATRTLDIAVYSMTHTKIAESVVSAHRRGVEVRIVMDKSQSDGRYSSAT